MFFLALAALTKVESTMAAFAPRYAPFIAGQIWLKRFNWRLYVPGYSAAFLLAASVYGWFYLQVGRSLFDDNLFQLVQLKPTATGFTLGAFMGLTDLNQSLTLLATSIFLFALACAPVLLLARILKPGSPSTWRHDVSLAALCGLLAALTYFIPRRVEALNLSFRFVPFLALSALAVLAVRAWKNPASKAAALPLAILWALVLGSLSRMFLRSVSNHYGFYLLPPAFVALAVFFFRSLPGYFPVQPRLRLFAACAGLGFFSAQVIQHTQQSLDLFATRNTRIDTPRGFIALRDHDDMVLPGGKILRFASGKYWTETVAFLSALPRSSKVLIVPQGQAGLAFFSGLEDPYRRLRLRHVTDSAWPFRRRRFCRQSHRRTAGLYCDQPHGCQRIRADGLWRELFEENLGVPCAEV